MPEAQQEQMTNANVTYSIKTAHVGKVVTEKWIPSGKAENYKILHGMMLNRPRLLLKKWRNLNK